MRQRRVNLHEPTPPRNPDHATHHQNHCKHTQPSACRKHRKTTKKNRTTQHPTPTTTNDTTRTDTTQPKTTTEQNTVRHETAIVTHANPQNKPTERGSGYKTVITARNHTTTNTRRGAHHEPLLCSRPPFAGDDIPAISRGSRHASPGPYPSGGRCAVRSADGWRTGATGLRR